jgi:NADH dehydrogenase
VKVLVTGGTGFVGTRVVHAIRAGRHDVRALVRDPGSKEAKTLAAWGVELVPGDMTDADSVRRAAGGVDAVVHLVAILGQKREAYERIMIGGTRTLLDAAQEAGAQRFLLMSALGVSEETKEQLNYAWAKWEQERMAEASGLPYVIFRPSFVFGRDGGTLPVFASQVRYLPAVPVVGTRRFQPIWIDDLAEIFAQALTTDAALGRTFDLVGPDPVTWPEFIEALKRYYGKRRLVFQMPFGLARAGAAVLEKLPLSVPISREALDMLEAADQTAHPTPVVETFGVRPIGFEEQLRRGLA